MTGKANVLPAAFRERLAAIPDCVVSYDEPLSRHTGLMTGGPADAMCRPRTKDALGALLELLKAMAVPRLVLGHGTNLIMADSGMRGVVVKLEGEFRTVAASPPVITAGAGAPLSALVECSMRHDLGGLEFTTGIPGCVGGSLPGNAGTGEESLGARVDKVDFMDGTGTVLSVPGRSLGFAYRRSDIALRGEVIVSASFRLDSVPRREAAEAAKRYADRRRGQPVKDPNVGCMFKNPPGMRAGQLIEEAGLKGARVGGAEVSARHANFIVNGGSATTVDVLSLLERIRDRVLANSGVVLEAEAVLVNEAGCVIDPLGGR